MCGVIGIFGKNDVVHELYASLISLQHRGQDSAGIVTYNTTFHLKKGNGLVNKVFNEKNLARLKGNIGIGQTRYPTIGPGGVEDAQPFIVNAPFGIAMAHNGNVTNYSELRDELTKKCYRQLTSYSDVEVILNVFADEMSMQPLHDFSFETLIKTVSGVMERVEGSYSVVGMIANIGMFAFRDPYGIKPLCLGKKDNSYIVASESVILDHLEYDFMRDIVPGEVIFIDTKRKLHSKIINAKCAHPCIFEWVYFARPDSIIDKIEVYEARLRLGEKLGKTCLAAKIKPDVIVPIPDSGRGAAMAIAKALGVEQKEGLIKNYYIGRTFIMSKQSVRKNSVRQKLNPVKSVIKGKNVLLIDDSIVRGTTAKELVSIIRKAGAKKVYYAVTCPPLRYPCVYGIDMMTRGEFVARNRNLNEIKKKIGADALIYQTLSDMCSAVRGSNLNQKFCTACFTGEYPTGLDKRDILKLEKERIKIQKLDKEKGI
ncbi:MAG: amidophosphoribosyltransferase [Candidatus Latescibacteria bacterium]|nr:amidophosphoribosyltransferase [Candidatus Latescibacterota bacterium]